MSESRHHAPQAPKPLSLVFAPGTSFAGYGASVAHAKRKITHEMRAALARSCVTAVTVRL